MHKQKTGDAVSAPARARGPLRLRRGNDFSDPNFSLLIIGDRTRCAPASPPFISFCLQVLKLSGPRITY